MRWLNASDLRRPSRWTRPWRRWRLLSAMTGRSRFAAGRCVIVHGGRVGASPGSRWCRRSRVTRQASSPCSVPTHPLGLVDGPTLTAIRTEQPADWPRGCWLRPGLWCWPCSAPERWPPIRWRRSGRCARSRGSWYGAARESGGGAGGSGWRRGDRRRRWAVAAADIVCCATPASSPLFVDRSWHRGRTSTRWGLHPGHGRDPTGDDGTRSTVVDDVDAASVEAGDLIRADRAPNATIGDLLAGRAPEIGEDVTVFKSVGSPARMWRLPTWRCAEPRSGLGVVLIELLTPRWRGGASGATGGVDSGRPAPVLPQPLPHRQGRRSDLPSASGACQFLRASARSGPLLPQSPTG